MHHQHIIFHQLPECKLVEVLKGSSQIQYGPYTTGGAINFVSTEIPKSFKGKISTSYGSFNTGQTHTTIGNSSKNFGYMLEYLNYNSNGFKSLGNKLNTGFDINEITSKFRFEIFKKSKTKQSLEFKFHHYDEISNETYLGLTNSDFDKNPFLGIQVQKKIKWMLSIFNIY